MSDVSHDPGLERFFSKNKTAETEEPLWAEKSQEVEHVIGSVEAVTDCARNLTLNSRDITAESVFLHSRYTTFPMSSSIYDDEEETAATHEDRMLALLESFCLSRVDVSKDGDCLFHAIIRQLEISGEYNQINSCKGKIHDDAMNAFWLRLCVLEEIELNIEDYRPFLTNMTRTKIAALIQIYSSPGQFAGDFGDLIPVAAANYLGRIIILLSSNPHLPYQSITPQRRTVSSHPVYLAHNAFGCGHYDAVKLRFSLLTEVEPKTDTDTDTDTDTAAPNPTLANAKKCRCGVNFKTQKDQDVKKFCRTDSRCPCVASKLGCINCQCFNCENGQKSTASVTSRLMQQKIRSKHSLKLTRTLGKSCFDKSGVTVKTRLWNFEEGLVLASVRTSTKFAAGKLNVKKITSEYNSIVHNLGDTYKYKTVQQVKRKLALIQKKSLLLRK
jgi:hypothetical protein